MGKKKEKKNKRIIEYKIVKANIKKSWGNPWDNIEYEVNNAIKEGFIMYGKLYIEDNWIIQEMVRYNY